MCPMLFDIREQRLLETDQSIATTLYGIKFWVIMIAINTKALCAFGPMILMYDINISMQREHIAVIAASTGGRFLHTEISPQLYFW